MSEYEKWDLILQALSTVLVVLGLIYTGRQFRLAYRADDEKRRIRTTEYLLTMLESIKEPLEVCRTHIEEIGEMNLTSDDPVLTNFASSVLNELEFMATSIAQGFLVEEQAKSFSTKIIRVFELLTPYVQLRRRAVDSVVLWERIEELVVRWKIKR